ncbi:MAG: helix-hairpin-helix domain-containing protein [Elusimicrobiota bacterium]|nr:helix-hairpin-helix domain-containing protein [Elusimicrobiota bacterium]
MKKKKFILPVFLKLFFYVLILTFNLKPLTFLHSAFEQKPAAARSVGMGDAFAGFSNDTNAIDYNPAGLRLIPAFQFASTYTDIYGVEGMNYANVKFAFPVKGFGSLGFLYSDFGPSEYKESVLIFSHGFGLAEGIMFGYNLKSMGVKIKEYGSDSAFGLDLGVLARVSEDFALGVSAKNINEPEISKGNENLTEEFLTGIFYRPLAGLNFALDFEKIIDKPVAVHIGTEFRLTDFFVFRTGLQTNPSKYALGFGTNYKTIYFDYGYSSHATLDAMHVVSLSMKYGGEQEASIKYAPKTKKAPRTTRKRTETSRKTLADTEEVVSQRPAGKVNINTASADEIAELPGMGKVMAKRVVDYRGEKGQFGSIEDILNVPRMSRRVYSKIEGLITVSAAVKKTEEKVKESEPPAEAPAKPAVSNEDEEPQPDAEEPEVAPAPAVVPAKPEVAPVVPAIPVPPADSGRTNINKADMSQLRDLGFTTVQSQNILRYIKKNGSLSSVDDLKKIPGISPDIVEEVKDNITVE